MSIKQARRLHVLEEVTGGVITNREASAALGLSVRQVQRIKTGYEEAGASSLVHGNTGRKPSNFIPTNIRALVAERAVGLWKGASASHMSELLFAEAGRSVSPKTITRILKGASLKNPFSHKGPRKRRRRARMERFGQMLQIDASPFDWLSNGSMITLHGAIDDATGSVTALRFERTECLDGYFHVLEETILKLRDPRVPVFRRPLHLLFPQPFKALPHGGAAGSRGREDPVRQGPGDPGHQGHQGPLPPG